MSPTIEAILTVAAFGTAACAYLARPKSKPSDFERREAHNRAIRAQAAWRAAKAAHRESKPYWIAFRNAKAEVLRLEGGNLARGWRNGR